MFVLNWLGRGVLVAILLFMVCLTIPGCFGGGASGDFATVSGKVTHKGKALTDAKIIFISTVKSDGARTSIEAMTDSSGEYYIAGFGNQPGLPPGQYKVTVTKLVDPSGKALSMEEGFDMIQLELSGMGKNLVPSAYSDFETTKLSAKLKSGENKKDFNIK